VADPSLWRQSGQVAFEHERVVVGDQLVATLDGGADQGGDLRVHPWLDHTSDRIVVFVGLEAVDCKAR